MKIIIQAGLVGKESPMFISLSNFFSFVNGIMLGKCSQKKIFNSVVVFNPINVVNKLKRFKNSSKFIFHCQSTSLNIFLVCTGMVRIINKHISSFVNNATLPTRGFISNLELSIVPSNKSRNLVSCLKTFFTTTLTYFVKLFHINYYITNIAI